MKDQTDTDEPKNICELVTFENPITAILTSTGVIHLFSVLFDFDLPDFMILKILTDEGIEKVISYSNHVGIGCENYVIFLK